MVSSRNTTTNVNVKTDYVGNLEKSIIKYKGKGGLSIIGNLNARVDNKGDIHNSKLNNHLNYILPNSDDASKLT